MNIFELIGALLALLGTAHLPGGFVVLALHRGEAPQVTDPFVERFSPAERLDDSDEPVGEVGAVVQAREQTAVVCGHLSALKERQSGRIINGRVRVVRQGCEGAAHSQRPGARARFFERVTSAGLA